MGQHVLWDQQHVVFLALGALPTVVVHQDRSAEVETVLLQWLHNVPDIAT